jgi:pimeloyl-ACP methyl ester carboxylesterase
MLKSFAAGTIFGESYGDGPPQILALHGWARDRQDFREVLVGLDAVAIDLPGFGASPHPSEPLGAGGYAELLIPVLDDFGEAVVLVGHSFGGRVAVHLALLRPARVRRLVLVGVPLLRPSSGPGQRPPLGYRIIRTLHRRGWVGEARLEAARHKYGSTDYRAARGVMRDVLVKVVNETYEAQLSELTQPVHLVWGAEDQEVPVEVARQAAGLLHQPELVVLEGVGHHVLLEAPEAVRAAVLGVKQ